MTTNVPNTDDAEVIEGLENGQEVKKKGGLLNKIRFTTAAAVLAASTNVAATNLDKEIEPIIYDDDEKVLIADASPYVKTKLTTRIPATETISFDDKTEILQNELSKGKNAKELAIKLQGLTEENKHQSFRVFSQAYDLNQDMRGIERKAAMLSALMINLLDSLQNLDGNSIIAYQRLEKIFNRFDNKPPQLERVMGGYRVIAKVADKLGMHLADGPLTEDEAMAILEEELAQSKASLAQSREELAQSRRDGEMLDDVLEALKAIKESRS